MWKDRGRVGVNLGYGDSNDWKIRTRTAHNSPYGGNFTTQAGIQWRGTTGRLFRFGFHYFNGMSDQYEFVNQHEEQIGTGVWYDY